MTMDGWTGIMYNLMDSADYKIVPVLYCSSIVFLCSFFMLNLLLVVIMEQYAIQETKFHQLQKDKLDEKRKDLEKLIDKKNKEQCEL
jgi:hypothetical protein